MFSIVKYWWTWLKWKRRAHRRRRPILKIGRLKHFFLALNEADVHYVVLRWFGEIPLSDEAERAYDGDLDILVDSADFRKFARVVADHPGRTRIDLYSEGVQMGTGYARLPYYPPPKANELLANRSLYAGVFYVPASPFYLKSLVYHLVYHKGLLSGLDDGLSGQKNMIENHHPVDATLDALAAENSMTLPDCRTLLSLHEWLVAKGWNMPYDLLARWGKKDAWHNALQGHLEQKLSEIRGNVHDILVFLIREDALQAGADTLIQQRLAEHFQILDTVNLDEAQQKRVMNQTRGADWTRHKSKRMVRPMRAIVCHDPAPKPVTPECRLAKIHFNVRNENVFYKHELRAELEKMYPDAAANFLHGSDNDLESTAYILAIYGEDSAREKLKFFDTQIHH